MFTEKLSLGIDTSNYKTSVAVVDGEGNILFNAQEFLDVKEGERGLRQSDAFFQHVKKLPHIISKAISDKEIRNNIGCIAVSTRPRPVEGSYMPVFMAGESFAGVLASSLNVPGFEFSHQEGHIEAVRYYSPLNESDPFISFHFSGGTTEAILVNRKEEIFEIVGGSRDLAYGQVLDRIGVSLGMSFPCGAEMDSITQGRSCQIKNNHLTKIKVIDGYVNLSGIETQAQRLLDQVSSEEIIFELFQKLSSSILEMTIQLSEKHGINNFLYAGGVSSSAYIKHYLLSNKPHNLQLFFADSKLASDNAIGIALLGGKKIWP